MDGIKGAIAVVTGAAQGNGEAIAKGLAQNGAKVALADVRIDIAETVAAAIRDAGGKAVALPVDVAFLPSATELAAAVREAFGPAARADWRCIRKKTPGRQKHPR